MKGMVLVVKADDLYKITEKFQGFKELPSGILEEIEKNAFWMPRKDAEIDPTYKQIIPYGIIRSPSGKIFFYHRSKRDKDYPEKRLQGKGSIGIGGHIEPNDAAADENKHGLIISGMLRELKEISFDKITVIKLLGGINDDLNEVGKVHFGLLFIVQLSTERVEIASEEIEDGLLVYPEELKKIFDMSENIEPWSKIALSVISGSAN